MKVLGWMRVWHYRPIKSKKKRLKKKRPNGILVPSKWWAVHDAEVKG